MSRLQQIIVTFGIKIQNPLKTNTKKEVGFQLNVEDLVMQYQKKKELQINLIFCL